MCTLMQISNRVSQIYEQFLDHLDEYLHKVLIQGLNCIILLFTLFINFPKILIIFIL